MAGMTRRRAALREVIGATVARAAEKQKPAIGKKNAAGGVFSVLPIRKLKKAGAVVRFQRVGRANTRSTAAGGAKKA